MSGKHILLHFGVVRDKKKEKKIKQNFPPNFRKEVLFDQSPYVAHLENPAFVDVVKNGIVDDLSLQKYLLATGPLKDNIQDSLDIIVSDDGKLRSCGCKKTTRNKISIRDKAKFDTQSPTIGTLLTQIESGKLTNEKLIKKQSEAAPSITGLKIVEQLKRSRDFN